MLYFLKCRKRGFILSSQLWIWTGGKESQVGFENYEPWSYKAIKNSINIMSHGWTIQLQSVTFLS